MIYVVWLGHAENPRIDMCCVTQDKNLVMKHLRKVPEYNWLEVWENGVKIESCSGKDSFWLRTS